ncbi:hypothetical protein ACLOJK_008247 [Asimina triloba]
MARGNGFQSPTIYPKDTAKETIRTEDVETRASMVSPGFLSAAAMAGWDEEALLLATLIVEDTPERESKHKKRLGQPFRTPPSTNSRRKRRDGKEERFMEVTAVEEEKKEGDEGSKPAESSKSDRGSSLPCMDRLREELSCALLFPEEIEVRKAALAATNNQETKDRSPKNAGNLTRNMNLDSNATDSNGGRRRRWGQQHQVNTSSTIQNNIGRRRTRWDLSQQEDPVVAISNDSSRRRRRGMNPGQEDDEALAFRLQREEFMGAFGESSQDSHELGQPSSSFISARANLRAMASAFGETHEHGQPSSSSIAARANLRAMASAVGETHERRQPTSSFISARANLRAIASRAITLRLRGHPT